MPNPNKDDRMTPGLGRAGVQRAAVKAYNAYIRRAVLATVVAALLLSVGLFLAVTAYSKLYCSDMEQVVERDVHWSVISGCYVQTERGYVPIANWRVSE